MSSPCNEELAKLIKRYRDAEDAYHDLMTGVSARVIVDQNSERVEFTAANRLNLLNYLTALKAQICRLDPSNEICKCGMYGSPRGPLGVLF